MATKLSPPRPRLMQHCLLCAQSGLGGRGREPVCDPAGLLRGVPNLRRAELWSHPEASVSVAALLVADRNDDAFAGAGERRGMSCSIT